jgi:hypothetical protein
MSEHTAENDAALRSTLLAVLMDEYGGTAEDWTAMGSLTRVERAVRECVIPPGVEPS